MQQQKGGHSQLFVVETKKKFVKQVLWLPTILGKENALLFKLTFCCQMSRIRLIVRIGIYLVQKLFFFTKICFH